MALITWNDKLSVNIEEIDAQHKKLVKLINDLSDAMKIGKGKDIICNIINDLEKYTVVHFSKEEKYFDKFGFKETVTHKLEHKKFVNEVKKFKQQFNDGSIGISVSVMAFISDWLKNHIMVSDKNYVTLFQQNGLK